MIRSASPVSYTHLDVYKRQLYYWQLKEGTWYYATSDGKAYTGWLRQGGAWYLSLIHIYERPLITINMMYDPGVDALGLELLAVQALLDIERDGIDEIRVPRPGEMCIRDRA